MPTILKSSLLVSVFLVLNILANFAVEADLAAILGASAEMDVYLSAVVVPEYLILLLQAGVQFLILFLSIQETSRCATGRQSVFADFGSARR